MKPKISAFKNSPDRGRGLARDFRVRWALDEGDLMMVTVLRRLRSTGVLEEFPSLDGYVKRAEARPAYQKAFAAQLAVYNESLR